MDAGSSIRAARDRLRGQLVATPLIGGVALPGVVAAAGDLRIKAECLQTGGGVWFRGALHALGRGLGGFKGVVAGGPARRVHAAVCAATQVRAPCVAVVDGAILDPELRALLEASDCELVVTSDLAAAVDEAVARTGFSRMPDLDSEAYAHGIATLGLELADELPFDTATVFVSPAELAAPIELGLRAGSRGCAVRGVEPRAPGALLELAAALRVGARIVADEEGLAALDLALVTSAGPSPCVVLSS